MAACNGGIIFSCMFSKTAELHPDTHICPHNRDSSRQKSAQCWIYEPCIHRPNSLVIKAICICPVQIVFSSRPNHHECVVYSIVIHSYLNIYPEAKYNIYVLCVSVCALLINGNFAVVSLFGIKTIRLGLFRGSDFSTAPVLHEY